MPETKEHNPYSIKSQMPLPPEQDLRYRKAMSQASALLDSGKTRIKSIAELVAEVNGKNKK